MTETSEQRIELVALSALIRAPRNPKAHDLNLIDQSFDRFGFVEPIIVNEATGRLVAGHGRLETLKRAKAAGEPPPERVVAKADDWYIPTLRGTAFASDEDAEAYLLASNQLVSAGGWNEGELAKVLGDLAARSGVEGLRGTGFDADAVDALLRKVGKATATQDDEDGALDRAAELAVKWGTAVGQIWSAGPHRLYCGDSRQPPEGFFGVKKISLVWTDPPYGVNYVAEKQRSLRKLHKGLSVTRSISGDSMTPELTEQLFAQALAAARPHCAPGAVIYAAVPTGPLIASFIRALETGGFSFKHLLTWVKHHFVLSGSDYQHRFEGILYGWIENGAHYFLDDRTQSDVLEFDKPQASPLHPTTKPVELVARMISNSSRADDLLYDPFAGSGTTLVAAAQLGRIGYGIELDPAYVAVCLERLANLGLEPRLIDGGLDE